NAAGAVRIALTPGGIELELTRVASFALDFAPGGVAEPVAFSLRASREGARSRLPDPTRLSRCKPFLKTRGPRFLRSPRKARLAPCAVLKEFAAGARRTPMPPAPLSLTG